MFLHYLNSEPVTQSWVRKMHTSMWRTISRYLSIFIFCFKLQKIKLAARKSLVNFFINIMMAEGVFHPFN